MLLHSVLEDVKVIVCIYMTSKCPGWDRHSSEKWRSSTTMMVIVRFVDIGGIVYHHCLDVIIT